MKKLLVLVYLSTALFCGSMAVKAHIQNDNEKAFQYEMITFVSMTAPGLQVVSPKLGMKAILGRPDGQGGTDFVTVLQNHLLNYLNSSAPSVTQEAIAKGRLIFNPVSYYIRFLITGLSGKQKILSETTQKAVGVTNFNLGYLPKFSNFAWNRISIQYVDDAVNATPQTLTGWSNVRGSVDKSVANGELIISSAGSPIFENPISPFLFAAAPTTGSVAENSTELDQVRVLRENELITIELNLAAAVPSAGGHAYGIEVQLHGLECKLGTA